MPVIAMTEQYCEVIPKKELTQEQWIKAHVKPGDPKIRRKDHTFTPCHYMIKSAPLPNTPLTGITDDMGFTDEKGDYHHFLIVNGDVFMNGSIIASAPVYGNNGRKKTVAQQHTFCKGVIWSLRNDDGALLEYAAKYPSLLPAAVPTVNKPEVDLQEYNNGVDLGTIYVSDIWGYPNAEVTDDLILYAQEQQGLKDNEIIRSNWDNSDMGSEYDSLSLEDEYNKGEEVIMWALINPCQVVRQWSHRGMSIIEEMISA